MVIIDKRGRAIDTPRRLEGLVGPEGVSMNATVIAREADGSAERMMK